MKYPLSFLIAVILLTLSACVQNQNKQSVAHESPPNFIIIFTDDQGYGDLGCFGATHVQTPT
ncbi:MAG: hypothetical protein O2887_17230 [Bacteroidetes bacterium]|nr:hypothetical protein [Bacteroidota bacterium]MDA1122202.1 hypothetical protein [Bacteroidota bacterium]